jgi:hypothetical protein
MIRYGSGAVAFCLILAWAEPARAGLPLSEVQKIIASDGQASDLFGWRVAIDGNTAIVGAPLHDVIASDQGEAYIFQRDLLTGVWSQAQQLFPGDPGVDNLFGNSVAISGDFAVVGAPGNDIGSAVDQGAAYVFARNQGGSGNWGQVLKLIASDGRGAQGLVPGDGFGQAVGISGNTIVVGAPFHQVGTDVSGAAYIFLGNGIGGWNQMNELSSGKPEEQFGDSVAIDGQTVAVGSPAGVVGPGGLAYVFARDQGGPGQWGLMKEINLQSSYFLGDDNPVVVAINQDTVVVGASGARVGTNLEQGISSVHERNAGGVGNWGQVAVLVAADAMAGEQFGLSVGVSGDRIAVGKPRSGAIGSGAVYLFDRNQGGTEAWGQFQKLTAAEGQNDDIFGASLALGEVTLLVGAARDDVGTNVDQGSAYFFSRPTPLVFPSAVVQSVGSTTLQAPLGTASDTAASASTLFLQVNGSTSATVNGVTLSNLTIDSSGVIRADVSAACNARAATFTLTVADPSGLSAELAFTINSAPSNPPVLQLRPGTTLWPPDHKYRTVGTAQMVASAIDDCDGDLASHVVIEQITSDEPDDAPGDSDGSTTQDAVIATCQSASLRAERDERRNGRVYGVTLRVADSEGNVARAVFPVAVPISLGTPAIDDGPAFTVEGSCQ